MHLTHDSLHHTAALLRVPSLVDRHHLHRQLREGANARPRLGLHHQTVCLQASADPTSEAWAEGARAAAAVAGGSRRQR